MLSWRSISALGSASVIAAACLGAASAAAAQTETGPPAAGNAKEEQPYHVESDVTEAYTSGGERVIHGIGHVVIVHGDTAINADEVYSYEAKR